MIRSIRLLVGFLAALCVVACVSIGNTKFAIKPDFFQQNYAQIKAIAVEEAANNGFGTLTSEVKPSEFNEWKGSLFFQLKTANGIDQLFVDFERAEGGVRVWVHGAGTRSNPDSAGKSIQAKVAKLMSGPGTPQPAWSANGGPAASATTTAAASPSQTLRTTNALPISSASSARSVPNLSNAPTPATSAEPAARMSAIEAQQKLIDLKYLRGPADGKVGKGTVEAIKKFQQDNSLAISGALNADTIEKLRAAIRN